MTAVDADDPTVTGHATVTYQVIKGDEYFTVDDSGRSDTQMSLHTLSLPYTLKKTQNEKAFFILDKGDNNSKK